MSNLSTPEKHSHKDVTYNYHSPTLKKAMKPILQDLGPSPFKYYPILSSHHLKLEPYCDTCWAMKSIDQSGFDLHLLEAHNYACPNKRCPLQFVEQKHLQKHIPICKASLLLLENRKIREKRGKNLINFPLEVKKSTKKKSKIPIARQVKESENVWIICYPNNKQYCANQLKGYDETPRSCSGTQILCTDRKYCDPKNNIPIPTNKCYFYDKINEIKPKNSNKCKRITRKSNNKSNDSESDSDSDSDSDSSSSESDTETQSESDSDSDKDNGNNIINNNSNNNSNNNGNDGNNNGNGNNGNNNNNSREIRKITARYRSHSDTNTNNNSNMNDNINGKSDVLMADLNVDCISVSSGSSDSDSTFRNETKGPELNLPSLDYSNECDQPLPPSMCYKRKANDVNIINIHPHKKQKLLNNNINNINNINNMLYITTTTNTMNNNYNELPTPPSHPLNYNENINMTPICPSSTGSSKLIISSSSSNSSNDSQNEINNNIIHKSTNYNINNNVSNSGKKIRKICRIASDMSAMEKPKKHKRSRRKLQFGIKTTKTHSQNPKKKQKRCKKKPEIINLIESDNDRTSDSNNNNSNTLQHKWNNMNRTNKFLYIFHPYHIYSVSQQFVWKKDKKKKHKKNKKKKDNKKKQPQCFKLNKCNTFWSMEDLNNKWKLLQPELEQILSNNLGKNERFNGSEISFEFLNYVEIIPYENEIKPKHIITSLKLNNLLQKLYMSDSKFKYLNCYKQSFRSKMKSLLSQSNPTTNPLNNCNYLSMKCQIFLYSFLRCGVGLLTNAFNTTNSTKALHIHNAYYSFLNKHFQRQSVYNNAALRDIECKKENGCFKEFVFRNNHKIEDWSNCTLDLSLKMGGIVCNELENLLEQTEAIQSLKTLYNNLYPTKQLRLVNMGFFQSPATNPGQNWHTDLEFTSIHNKHTNISPVVTVIVSLIKQKYKQTKTAATTTGSTVFCLGSNHSPQQLIKICNKYPKECDNWLYRVIQPVLNIGDIVCFQGNTMHFGGAYDYIEKECQDRVVLYGVMHLLPKSAAHDEYLQMDMNIEDLHRGQSLFGGGRYTIVRKEENDYQSENDNMSEESDRKDYNPYFVKKNRWRDRLGC